MSEARDRSFDELIDEAGAVPIAGWDFSFLQGRTTVQSLPWNYSRLAAELVDRAARVLDVDTGGGKVFASLRPPPGSVAVEPYRPNVPIATERLAALGVQVVERTDDRLPVADSSFELVLNRHGHFDASDVFRVLTAGGTFLTQQVGPRNDIEFNAALGESSADASDLPPTVASLEQLLADVGFRSCRVREARTSIRYLDIGAVVFQLRAIPWQVPGFTVERYYERLRGIHEQIVRTGGFEVHSHRLLIQADRPR